MPTIFKMLDLSTRHLPEEVCDDLNAYDGVLADERVGYGWLIWVPTDIDKHVTDYLPDDDADEEEGSIPTSIVAIWRFAQKHDCQYVLIDRDGAEYTALPSYDW